ncbi:hypothetical protein CU097_003171, partial [Rhizopus azygosporus]
DINVYIAARAWINSTIYSSVYYYNYRQEFKHGNHIVKFYGYNNKKFVDFIQFFFKHVHNGVERSLAFIEMTRSIGCCHYDSSITVVGLHGNEEDRRKYIVDIIKTACQVGLVVALREEMNLYKVITPYSMHL